MTKPAGGATANPTPSADQKPPEGEKATTTANPTPSTDQKPPEGEKATTTAYEVAPGRTVGGKGPGEKVDLEDGDALRFFELGFILDEDGNRAGFADGPKTVAGVEIKEV